MTTDLGIQIRDYFDEVNPPFEPGELMAQPDTNRITDGQSRGLGRPFPGWEYAAATAVVILSLVGGGVWLSNFQGGEVPPVITQPTTLTPPPTALPPGTLPEVITLDPSQITSSLPGDVTSGVAIADGVLWTSTELGIVRWDLEDRSGQLFTSADGLPIAAGASGPVAIAADGTVWTVTSNQDLAYFDGTRWSEPPGYDQLDIVNPRCSVDGGCLNPITALATGPDGLLSVAVGGETLLRYDGVDWAAIPVTPSEIHGGDAWATDMDVAPDGTLWVASWEELLQFDGDEWSRFTATDGLPSGRINSVAVAPNGDIWVGTTTDVFEQDVSGGIARFDGDSWTVFSETNGLYANASTALAVGRDGSVWAVHDDAVSGLSGSAGGVSLFKGTTWAATTVAGVGEPFGWGGAAADDTGTLWITSRWGIVGFNGTGPTVLRFPDGPRTAINELPFTLPSQILPGNEGPLEWRWDDPVPNVAPADEDELVKGDDCYGGGGDQGPSATVEFNGSRIDFTLGYLSTPDIVVTEAGGTVSQVGNPFGEQAWLCSVAATDTHLLAVGSGVSWSEDGIAWHAVEAFEPVAGWNVDGSNLMWAAAGPGGYMVLGRTSAAAGLAWLSADLQTWHEYSLPLNDTTGSAAWGWVGPRGVAMDDDPIILMNAGTWFSTRLAN
jgi:sugar lactone lactonase YvrE